jgi:succinate dehydrogenase/fumarate reductase iron-sulfur protein
VAQGRADKRIQRVESGAIILAHVDGLDMPEDTLAKVKVFRFNPEFDIEHRYDEFGSPYKGRTVLDVLIHIRDNLDSTLAFRWACTKAYCRCCVLSVNGKPVLACKEPASKNMKIEPHPKFKVLKDLIVDFNELK